MKLLKVLGIGLITFLLVLSFGWGEEERVTRPVSSILNKDGTLKIGQGASGSFDARGYRLVSGPREAPRFAAADRQMRSAFKGERATGLAAGDEYWDSRFGNFYTSDSVYAIAVSGTDIYLGGSFTSVGGVTANCVAKWNGSSWSALGSGVGSIVFAVAVSGTDVYVGGQFTQAGGVATN
jgi:hypothetical protein